MSNELKPCPWCRGEAKSWLVQYGRERGTWSVGCTNGECGIEPVQNGFVLQEDADAAWNTRVVDAENERLRTLVEAVVYWLETTNIYQIDAAEMSKQIRKCREALEGTK